MRRNLSDGELIAAFIRSTILSSNLIQLLYSERVDQPVTMRQLFALLYLLFQTTKTHKFSIWCINKPRIIGPSNKLCVENRCTQKVTHCKLRTSFSLQVAYIVLNRIHNIIMHASTRHHHLLLSLI